VEEFFISSLLLPDGEPVLVRLDVLSFLDIGGSLSISLQLDRMLLVSSNPLFSGTGLLLMHTFENVLQVPKLTPIILE
jgi:hypothetical protein